MAKVAVLGLNSDREVVVSVLHDLGVFQVEPVGKEALEFLEPERASELQRQVGDQLVRFRGLVSALPAVAPGTPFAFSSVDELLRAAQSIPIDEEVGRLKREEDQLTTERHSLTETLALLRDFSFFTGSYANLVAQNAAALFGEGPADGVRRWRAATPALQSTPLDLHDAGDKRVRFLLVLQTGEIEGAGRLASAFGVRLTSPPKLGGTAAEETPRLQARLTEVEARLGEIRTRLTALGVEWFPRVAALEEAFDIENRKLDVYSRFGTSKRAFALEGWVPKRNLHSLRQTILASVGDRAELYQIPTHEEPPTLMENPAGVRRYEFFIRFYSLPTASEWDPTWVFAIAFPVFFGLMLGDWGYGVVILGFCLWMIADFPGRRYIPKAIKNFLKMIMGPDGMRSLAYALVPGCVIAILLGLAFNDFFGAHLPFYTSPLDPLANLGTFLLLAGYVGVTMVALGFVLGAIKEFVHRNWRHLVSKIAGILSTFGFAITGLEVLRKTFDLASLGTTIPLALALGGFALLLVGEGGQGILTALEVVSHILSYTRIIGILLASVILASVINSNGTALLGHGGVLGIVFFGVGLLILIGGQTFNLILGVFEPGIQGARLIFVEHFSKFYDGNGREFTPLRTARRHTAPAPAARPTPP